MNPEPVNPSRYKILHPVIVVLILTAISCKDNHTALYREMRSAIDSIKIIDTHEHQGFPWMKKHNAFDIGMYMETDLISSGMPELTDSMIAIHDVNAYWEHIAPYLRYVRGTTYYAQFIKNLQVMYHLKSDELSKEDYLRISEQIDANYKNYAPWLNAGLQKLNIDYMLVDRVWDPFNPVMEHEKFGFVFRFDQLILMASQISKTKKINHNAILKLLERNEFLIRNLKEYLTFIDHVFTAIIKNKVIALKIGLAYHRSLAIDRVNFEAADKIYSLPEKRTEQIKILQDFLTNYIVQKAAEHALAIQIHTGYLHGNNINLMNGHPNQLIPLFINHPKARFVIFHGGYPWTGDFVVLGKHFTNVYVDLVWLPQLSRTAAIRTLHELFDTVPYNKICWGGDVGKIDETAGSLELAKDVVATVLTERIEKGWLSKEAAIDICKRIFRENALEIYRLK